MKYTVREKEQPLNIIYDGDNFNDARVAQCWPQTRFGYRAEADIYDEHLNLINYRAAECALEALTDDIMEPDGQKMDITARYTADYMVIDWSWHGYSNTAKLLIDGNLDRAVKAYCFDLIVMTRNL